MDVRLVGGPHDGEVVDWSGIRRIYPAITAEDRLVDHSYEPDVDSWPTDPVARYAGPVDRGCWSEISAEVHRQNLKWIMSH